MAGAPSDLAFFLLLRSLLILLEIPVLLAMLLEWFILVDRLTWGLLLELLIPEIDAWRTPFGLELGVDEREVDLLPGVGLSDA